MQYYTKFIVYYTIDLFIIIHIFGVTTRNDSTRKKIVKYLTIFHMTCYLQRRGQESFIKDKLIKSGTFIMRIQRTKIIS